MASGSPTTAKPLDLSSDVVTLARTLCDTPSVSGDEAVLADRVEGALRALPHLSVIRDGDAVVASTNLGRPRRVLLAGHLDTVPIAENLPTWTTGHADDEVLHGRGTVDMKSGVAVQLAVAARVQRPRHDLTFVFYDNEEVASWKNGLARLARTQPEALRADFAVLGEPTNQAIEGGCQGTMKVEVTVPGVKAHSARSWMGVNAIHESWALLERLHTYKARSVEIDGLEFVEGLNAVGVRGGIAGNVIPDECVVSLNFRFAPDRDSADAEAHVRDVLEGYQVYVADVAPAAAPRLDHPAAAELVEAVANPPRAKLGWTDVARFAGMGVPAVNYGPGDPRLAHSDVEHCPTAAIRECESVLFSWLG